MSSSSPPKKLALQYLLNDDARRRPASSSQDAKTKGDKSKRSKMIVCDQCAKTFVERGNLNKHISSVHLKERNKVCPEVGCGKSFSFRDGLVRHIAHVHENQRLHKCRLCDKSFKQGSHLSKHMRSIHKIKEEAR